MQNKIVPTIMAVSAVRRRCRRINTTRTASRRVVHDAGSSTEGATVSGVCEFLDDGRVELVGQEPGRSFVAQIAQEAALADECQPVGGAAVGSADAVVNSVDDDRHADGEPKGAGRGNGDALVVGGRITDLDTVVAVDGQHPTVLGMGLAHVDHEEMDLPAIAVPELMNGAQLVPEGRSGVAPEDQRNWLVRSYLEEMKRGARL